MSDDCKIFDIIDLAMAGIVRKDFCSISEALGTGNARNSLIVHCSIW